MSRLVEILKSAARTSLLTGALAGSAVLSYFYTQAEMIDEIDARDQVEWAVAHDGQYDFNNSLVDFQADGLERVMNSLYTVRTKSVFEKEKDGSQVEMQMEGGGTILLGKYFVTVDHVVNSPGLIQNFGFFTVKEDAEKLSETSYLLIDGKEVEMEAVYCDERNDIAVFKIPEGVSVDHSFPYELGESDELRPGHLLYVVGVPGLLGKNVREGICSSTKLDERLDKFWETDNAFMVSNGINPGDSGTMVVAVRDGKYELVGLPQGKFTRMESMGWAVGISPLKKLLREYLKENDLAGKYRDLYELVK